MKLTEQNRSMSWNRHQTQAFSHSQIAEMAEDLQGDYLKDTALPGFADSPVREVSPIVLRKVHCHKILAASQAARDGSFNVVVFEVNILKTMHLKKLRKYTGKLVSS